MIISVLLVKVLLVSDRFASGYGQALETVAGKLDWQTEEKTLKGWTETVLCVQPV